MIHRNQIPNAPENVDPIVNYSEYDGQAFCWAPGQVRVFADDGVAARHATNTFLGNTTVIVDDSASGIKDPCTFPARS